MDDLRRNYRILKLERLSDPKDKLAGHQFCYIYEDLFSARVRGYQHTPQELAQDFISAIDNLMDINSNHHLFWSYDNTSDFVIDHGDPYKVHKLNKDEIQAFEEGILKTLEGE